MIATVEARVLGSNRRRLWLGLGVALFFVTLPFLEVLIGTRTAMWSDVVAAQVPRYIAVWANLRHGLSPFWWRNMFGGFNTLGGGQSGIFYLPNALFGWLSPMNAFRWWFFGHLWAMTAGWYAWSWRRWQSVLGATVCAIAGTLNGYVIYHSTSMAFIAAWTLLPWAFLALDRLMETSRLRYVAILAVLIAGIAMQLAQFLWLTLIALGVLTLFTLARRGVGVGPWLRVGAAVVLGIGLSAVQLLPSLAFSKTSVRPTLTRAAAFEFSMEPRHLLTLLVPNIMGGANSGLWWKTGWLGGPLINELANYLGVTIAALAVIGAIKLGRNRFSLALVTLAVLGVLASLGGRTFVGNLLFDIVPFANRFRAWARDLLWTYIAVIMLAGAGAREVARMPRRWFVPLLVGAAGLGAVMLVLPVMTNLSGALLHGGEGALARFIPVLFLLALAGTVWAMTRSRVLGAAALVVVCALDLGSFAFTASWRSFSLTPAQVPATISNAQPPFGGAVAAPGGLARWVSDIPDASAFWPSVIGHQFESVNGYDPLLQSDYSVSVGYMAYLGYMPDHIFWEGGWLPDVLRVTTLLASPYAGQVSTRWAFSHRYEWPRNVSGTTQATGPVIAPYYDIYTYKPRLPESYLVGATRLGSLDDARSALTTATDTDLTQYAYVDGGTIPEASVPTFQRIDTPGFSGAVRSGSMNDGGSGTWAVAATRPSLFVTSYAWMDGWHATVDGKSVPVARANALVLGVPVPAGTHTVHVFFTPPGWAKGRAVSLASLLVLVVLLLAGSAPVRSFVRRRRDRSVVPAVTSGSDPT
jgi:hypothetical protein